MSALLTLATKDLRLLVRDRAGLFFSVFFPVLYAVFFGTVFSGAAGDYKSRRIGIPFVDEDRTPASAAFLRSLTGEGQLQIEITDRDAALDLVRHGRRAAAVVVPKGFGEARSELFRGVPTTVQIAADPSRPAEAEMVKGLVVRQLYAGIQEIFTDRRLLREQMDDTLAALNADPDADPVRVAALTAMFEAVDRFMVALDANPAPGAATSSAPAETKPPRFEPVRIEPIELESRRIGPKNFYAVSFPQGIIWGVMSCAATFGISLVVERTGGTLRRLRTTPAPRAAVLGGKAVACLLSTLCVCALLLGVARLGFGVRPISLAGLSVAVACVCVAFAGIMMLLSVLGRTEQSAGGIGWAVLLVMAMIGGGMVPLFIMPGWIQAISVASPVRWAVLALEGAIWRDFSASEMVLPCTILIATGVACFVVGARLFARLDAR